MKTQTENNEQLNKQGTTEAGYVPQQQGSDQQPDRDRVPSGTQTDYRERTTRGSSVTTSGGARDNNEEISNRNEEGETADEEMDETLDEDDDWDEEDTMGDDDHAEADERAWFA